MPNNQRSKVPSPLLSLIPIAVLVILLFFTIRMFGADSLNGANQIVLLIAAAVCASIAIFKCKISWHTIEIAIVNNITGIAPALIILLLIGALSGSWMISGIVPTLICYGMKILHPGFFLAATCIICAIVSVMTGSSWTTVATIGIAFLGIGQAQGFDSAWIAGAIISGAYFGDKISPLSDTTILASSVTNTPLFVHIRYMMITTIPSLVIAIIIFAVASFSHHIPVGGNAENYINLLNSTFNISPWLLIVPVLTGVLIAKRVPSIVTLFLSSIMAIIATLIAQPELLYNIVGQHSVEGLFKGSLMVLYGPTQIETGNPQLNELISTNGMSGMMNTVWLIVCAMCFGGTMVASGMLGSLTSQLIRFMKNTVGLVASTVIAGFFFNVCTADQYMSIILTGDMFKNIYKSKHYESRLLSRTTEDCVTVTSVLIPWNTCGMTQATVLNVPTLAYLPYCFFNLISPLMSIFIASIGYKIFKKNENTESITAA